MPSMPLGSSLSCAPPPAEPLAISDVARSEENGRRFARHSWPCSPSIATTMAQNRSRVAISVGCGARLCDAMAQLFWMTTSNEMQMDPSATAVRGQPFSGSTRSV